MKPHAADCATCAIALAHDEEKEKRRASLDLIDREELGRFVVARCPDSVGVIVALVAAGASAVTRDDRIVHHAERAFQRLRRRRRTSLPIQSATSVKALERELGVSWDTIGRALAGRPLNAQTRATLRARMSPSAFGDAC